MKKYGRFIVGCVAATIMIICVLTSSIIARGPAWVELTHAILGAAAIIVFAIVATRWFMKGIFDPPTPWQKYDKSTKEL
ncbi:hypothetical protein KJ784_02215 [Patescibacteria group bacterium]|nr:hypothetical protein [Patescibacteria group bacterium]